MMFKRGDRGEGVEQLQLKLKAAGYDPGDVDGDYGKKTALAVLAFQEDRPDLDDDGVAGPMTLGALDAAIVKRKPTMLAPSFNGVRLNVPCEAATWAAFQRLVSKVTAHPVRYGPGRGLWRDGEFLVTYGAGRTGGTVKMWPNVLGRPYASFHCTSWTNFFLSWLLRRNEEFTHAGNIPSLFTLLEASPDVHQNPGGGPYRGFGDVCTPIMPDGSGAARTGVSKAIDAREVFARREALPTFIVWCQSTRRASGWKWWHHTGLFVVDHRDGSRLYRIAADGYKGPRGYSADPMRWTEITEQNIAKLGSCAYRAYGVDTSDGTYGDPERPIAEVDFETF